ncbi:hypothetical protein Tco_1079622 [Tanacetum coccineum]|uniref:Uncharacterized protein n=1 Tax=Tanacetum coccineum TaxID=301880 RepID=A0ABQ5HU40_9ASTR
MDNTRAQQKALDDELVAPADLALDALKLTPFYNAFEISADVPKIYMQEFWVTVSRHHSSLRFKLNGKSHTVKVDNFRDILKICHKLPGKIFKEPLLEEEILSFIRDLGHTGEIKFLSDVNVNHMHQPWRSFAAIINKCLSGKTTALESLCLSHAQILWGMYHNKTVDYVRSGKEESSKEATQKESKSTSSSKGASRSQPKSSGKSAQAEGLVPTELHEVRQLSLLIRFHQLTDLEYLKRRELKQEFLEVSGVRNSYLRHAMLLGNIYWRPKRPEISMDYTTTLEISKDVTQVT